MEMRDMKSSQLLIKFPTRNRCNKFFSALDRYYWLMTSNNFEFIISCDTDDITMNNDNVKKRLSKYPHLTVCYNDNKSKVEAINQDLAGREFDVLLLASDDMIPECMGYDSIIKNSIEHFFPDMDRVLWFNDGFQHSNLNTLAIIGKKYYDRFGYIYHPSYKSLYCDLEFTHVSKALDKVRYVNKCIIRHNQYSIIGEEPDELYVKNDSLQHEDLEMFNKRAKNNFDL